LSIIDAQINKRFKGKGIKDFEGGLKNKEHNEECKDVK